MDNMIGVCGKCIHENAAHDFTTAHASTINPTGAPTINPTGLVGSYGSGHCAGTQYPTPSPTLAPTQAGETFTSGTIVAALPAQYNFDAVAKCDTDWEECVSTQGESVRDCSRINAAGSNLYQNWQNEKTIPRSQWFGCQLLAHNIDGGRNYGNPGTLKPWADKEFFSPKQFVSMIKTGCYTISVLPEATTSSSVKRWSSAQEFADASSKSNSFSGGFSFGFGLFGLSVSYAESTSSSKASSGSKTNVGATFNRRIEIASVSNSCLDPSISRRDSIRERLGKVVQGLTQHVLDNQDVISVISPDGTTMVRVPVPTAKSVAYALQFARYGQVLPFSWKFTYYYIQEFRYTSATTSSASTSASSDSQSVGASGSYNGVSAGLSVGFGNAESESSSNAESDSSVHITVETAGKCAWYENANLGGPPPLTNSIAEAAGQAAADSAARAANNGRKRRLIEQLCSPPCKQVEDGGDCMFMQSRFRIII
jgi:hypothetical protein